jgi:hypothetical protein
MPNKPTEIESIVATDEWRSFKRVLPRDLHEELKRFEAIVGAEIGQSVSLGAAVAIWSIIVHFLRENEAELVQCAKEWAGED